MKVLIEHLRKLGNREIEPDCTGNGICWELRCLRVKGIDIDYNLIESIWSNWEHFSGNISFPLSSPDSKDDPATQWTSRYKWDNTPYGNLRRELCLYIADELEKTIEGESSE